MYVYVCTRHLCDLIVMRGVCVSSSNAYACALTVYSSDIAAPASSPGTHRVHLPWELLSTVMSFWTLIPTQVISQSHRGSRFLLLWRPVNYIMFIQLIIPPARNLPISPLARKLRDLLCTHIITVTSSCTTRVARLVSYFICACTFLQCARSVFRWTSMWSLLIDYNNHIQTVGIVCGFVNALHIIPSCVSNKYCFM